jgi:hypothetical protein
MSKINYCSSISCNTCTSEENIKKIRLLHNNAARVISGNVGKYDHVSPLLKELGWVTNERASTIQRRCPNLQMHT